MPAARVARANEPEATPEPSAERAQNRHGGAPRGAVPVARDGPPFANVASRDYARDRIKDTASRRSAIPSVGDRKLRRKEEPGHECPGNEETEDTNFVGWVERRARNPSNPVPRGPATGVAITRPQGRSRPSSRAMDARERAYGSTHPTERSESDEKEPARSNARGNEEDCAV